MVVVVAARDGRRGNGRAGVDGRHEPAAAVYSGSVVGRHVVGIHAVGGDEGVRGVGRQRPLVRLLQSKSVVELGK